MNKKQETIIKNYAHDYRDVALNQYVLENVLEKLSEEILKEQRQSIIEIIKKKAHKDKDCGTLEEPACGVNQTLKEIIKDILL